MIYNKRIGKEHNFHNLKANCGLHRIEYRGKKKCNTVSMIATIAYNLKKFHGYLANDKKLQQLWVT